MPNCNEPTLYDTDFIAWAEEQADALRALTPPDGVPLDLPNLIEEMETLARRELVQFEGLIGGALERLVRAALDPDLDRARGSLSQVTGFLRDACQRSSPTGLSRIDLHRLWSEACDRAEAHLSEDSLPAGKIPCPFGIEALLAPGFVLRDAIEAIRDLSS
jgi:hypothetical protein